MNAIPDLGDLDSTAGLMREGYTFIGRRCDRLDTDAFRTRILLRPTVCMRGRDAAELLYDATRFTRRDAMPASVVHLLQDEGSVQALDDTDHRRRKAIFLRILPQDGDDPAPLLQTFAAEWQEALPAWQRRAEMPLLDAMTDLLARVAATWVGAPLGDKEAGPRTREFSAMIDHAGSFGPVNWWARALRRRSERWATDLISRTRSGEMPSRPGTPLERLACRPDDSGALLSPDVAAIELLNLLRPIVAISRFITFAALALYEHPRWRGAFESGEDQDLLAFVQEVRRYYPFFPLIAGRARHHFAWRGHTFREGDLALLDLYGTNHDTALWQEPQAFRPERFRDWSGDPNTLVPQGGGLTDEGHRCPGEQTTIQLMAEAIRHLTRSVRYEVPAQDFSIALNRMPARPRDGFVIRRLRPIS